MRTLRPLTIGLALLTLLPLAASAQEGRYFIDSWFWGAKAGMMLYNTPRVENAGAPLVGAEMLITRKKAALYVAFDHSFFDKESTVPASGDGTTEIVDVKNLRRGTFALMAFPKQFGILRPYAGVGVSVNVVQEARPRNDFAGDTAFLTADQYRSTASAIFIGGLQATMRRFSLFGQASYAPEQRRFLLNNGATYFLEGGIRYNIGSSREHQD